MSNSTVVSLLLCPQYRAPGLSQYSQSLGLASPVLCCCSCLCVVLLGSAGPLCRAREVLCLVHLLLSKVEGKTRATLSPSPRIMLHSSKSTRRNLHNGNQYTRRISPRTAVRWYQLRSREIEPGERSCCPDCRRLSERSTIWQNLVVPHEQYTPLLGQPGCARQMLSALACRKDVTQRKYYLPLSLGQILRVI